MRIRLGLALGVALAGGGLQACAAQASTNRYDFRTEHDPDGTGKFYLGREIAQVMGHQGADWLERSDRDKQEHTEQLVEELELQPGQVVADIGAGTGYYSRRLAKKVGPDGRVLAVDIQPEMLVLLTNKLAGMGITNVSPILGTVTDPKLPERGVDLVLLVDVYHEFEFPWEMMRAITRSLKPGGRVVFVEFRAEDPDVPIKRVHKMSEAQVRKEMAAAGLEWNETDPALPWQHIIEFVKPGKVLFVDDFAGHLGEGWSWVREHRATWRVTDRGLEVMPEPGNMWGPKNDARNLLVRPTPPPGRGEVEVSLNVENKPTNQYEQVDLTWYYDDSNMVKLGLELVDGQRSVVMGREEQDRTRTISITPAESNAVQLRLIARGVELRGQFRPAGSPHWHEVGTCTAPSPPGKRPQISLQFYQGAPETDHWARVSGLRVVERE